MRNSVFPLNLGIYAWGEVSAAGRSRLESLQNLQAGKGNFSNLQSRLGQIAVGRASADLQIDLEQLYQRHNSLRDVDRVTQLGVLAALEAGTAINRGQVSSIGVSFGSSRGATDLLEKHYGDFLDKGKVFAKCSPTTTSGNLSSWVARVLGLSGVAIDHSMTCSTGLQSICNAIAWINAGLVEAMIVGASEAPLTDFSLAQMQALGIYSVFSADQRPCRPLGSEQNTFVLGEGAAAFYLAPLGKLKLPAVACIESFGIGFEVDAGHTSVSPDGVGIRVAMTQALDRMSKDLPVDAVILHAPGTLLGDCAEMSAFNAVFKTLGLPVILSNKQLIGHTFGAAGALSLAYACQIFNGLNPTPLQGQITRPIQKIMINALGFGGQAISMIVTKGEVN
ncbi:hypothetical protein JNK13_01115 [bacterium]|nr:hypothetical protein [bacterium]